MVKQLTDVFRYYIHKSIYLKNNNFCLQLKKHPTSIEPEISVIFFKCLSVEDTKTKNSCIEDFAVSDYLGMKYIFLAEKFNVSKENLKQIIIFDKEKEKKEQTGVIKKPMLDIICEDFIITEDVYAYKDKY